MPLTSNARPSAARRFNPLHNSAARRIARLTPPTPPTRVFAVYEISDGDSEGKVICTTCDEAEAWRHALEQSKRRVIIRLEIEELRRVIRSAVPTS